jgi:diadenosine tetraphosphate (Ap4A) HIT family hydrolase
MSGCGFCLVVRALRGAEIHRAPSGGVYRKIAELPASIAILGHDQFYRGYSVVIAKQHATELYHLPDAERRQYLDDMVGVAAAIDRAFRPRKMNYECLGNTVPHLHWHLFPRYAGDPNPKRPTWEHSHEPPPVSEGEAAGIIGAIRQHLT